MSAQPEPIGLSAVEAALDEYKVQLLMARTRRDITTGRVDEEKEAMMREMGSK